ncbi:MAG: CopG family transcriptional regulator [Desulfobacterales bacterium]|jgi:hypothetical protein
MRTTLTIDDDVAAALERIRKTRKLSFKALVNDALRQGLKEMSRPPRKIKPYKTKPVSLGRCLVGSLDDISEALAIAEGENFR